MGIDREWRAYAPGAALAIAVAAVQLASALIAGRGTAHLDALAYLLVLAGSLVLVAARRAPVAVLLIACGCVTVYELRGYPGIVVGLPVLVAVYTAVRRGHALTGRAALIGGLLAINLPPLAVRPTLQLIESNLLLSGWLVASAVMAVVSRQRAAYLKQVEQRAADAERTREETARRRAGEERLRIAREFHDSLTHSISVINVQAQVAVHLARKRGEDVPDALLAIQDASRDAMRELRATLEVLRQPEDASSGSGLDRLPDLLERVRSAGLPATATISGQQRALPADIDRAAYRIVQEALNNVARHAGQACVAVHIGYGPDELTVQVDDDGRATLEAGTAPGLGLIGMRERVTAFGGRLHAGARPEGGFTVRAQLPTVDAS